MKNKKADNLISSNKKAFFNYHILEKLECGIQLKGTEIKSIRASGCNLKESYVKIKKREAIICQMEIPPYKYGNIENHDPFRQRKLLLHKSEIIHLQNQIERKGLLCVPVKMYLKNGLAKIQIALAQSKKMYDKRDSIKKRDVQKEIERAIKYKNR